MAIWKVWCFLRRGTAVCCLRRGRLRAPRPLRANGQVLGWFNEDTLIVRDGPRVLALDAATGAERRTLVEIDSDRPTEVHYS